MRIYWRSVVGYGVGAPVLYLLAMGFGLGSLVDRHTGTIDQVSYLVFVGPALLVTTVVMECTSECTYTIIEKFTWQRIYYGVAATPVSPRLIAFGELVVVGLKLTLQATLFWVILLVSGGTGGGLSWLMVPVGVLAGFSFGAPLMAFSATRATDDSSFSLIQRFVVMPMFLFSGTFFPLESMPGYLQWVGWVSPMWHGTQLARACSYGLPLGGWAVLGHLAYLVALTTVGVWLAMGQYQRRLTR